MRKRITLAMVVGGLLLMIGGYFLAAPWGSATVENSNPNLPFSPLVFVIGVVMVFAAAVVYELLPDRKHQ
jgi:drug/metabolite transporter (DMT)-like permease